MRCVPVVHSHCQLFSMRLQCIFFFSQRGWWDVAWEDQNQNSCSELTTSGVHRENVSVFNQQLEIRFYMGRGKLFTMGLKCVLLHHMWATAIQSASEVMTSARHMAAYSFPSMIQWNTASLLVVTVKPDKRTKKAKLEDPVGNSERV